MSITATITPNRSGDYHIRVSLPDFGASYVIRKATIALKGNVVELTTTRLRRIAGVELTGDWMPTGNGAYSATVTPVDGRCSTCVNGCGCAVNSAGCGHHQCVGAAGTVRANTCPGALIHMAKPAKVKPRRKAIHTCRPSTLREVRLSGDGCKIMSCTVCQVERLVHMPAYGCRS